MYDEEITKPKYKIGQEVYVKWSHYVNYEEDFDPDEGLDVFPIEEWEEEIVGVIKNIEETSQGILFPRRRNRKKIFKGNWRYLISHPKIINSELWFYENDISPVYKKVKFNGVNVITNFGRILRKALGI